MGTGRANALGLFAVLTASSCGPAVEIADQPGSTSSGDPTGPNASTPGSTADSGSPTSGSTANPAADSSASSAEDSSSSSAGTDSTGTPTACGNGILDAGEVCDPAIDGSQDACLGDCQVLASTMRLEMAGAATGVVVSDDGSATVVGHAGPTIVRQPMVVGVSASGALSDVTIIDGFEDGAGFVDVARLPSGDLIGVGWQGVEDFAGLVVRLDADTLQTSWSVVYDLDPAGPTDVALSVDVIQDSEIVVGFTTSDANATDIRIAAYDPNGVETWSWLDPAPLDGRTLHSIAVLPGGDVAFVGDGSFGALFGRVSPTDGDVFIDLFDAQLRGLAVDDTGAALLLSTDWIERRSAQNLEVAQWRVDGLELQTAADVAVAPFGFVTTGTIAKPDDQLWVAAWTIEGDLLWSDVVPPHRPAQEIFPTAIGVGADGTVVVVGYELTDPTSDTPFVRRYTPFATD